MKNLRRNGENEMNEFISQELENQRFFSFLKQIVIK